jgi:hypothetical protein
MRLLRDLFDLGFPTVLTTREQYFITVSHRRMLAAALLGMILGLIL